MSREYQLWTEKYRPYSLDKIIGQDDIVVKLKGFVKTKNLPHCLFAGYPGTGKTTAALCLVHDLFGDEFADCYEEYNASDERGIAVVRDKIKVAAMTRSFGELIFKIIILDEADKMTPDAQDALRRIMELYSTTCRFIIICNRPDKIIEPIQSRCAFFRFKPIDDECIRGKINYISKAENVNITEDGIKTIIDNCSGDLRKTYNLLQAAASSRSVVDEKSILTILGRAKSKDVQEMLLTTLRGNLIKGRDFLKFIIKDQGVSSTDIINQLHDEIFRISNISELWKATLLDMVGEIEFRVSQGSNSEVQLSALIAKFVIVGEKIRSELGIDKEKEE